jgi:uncharacterized protein DUF4031
VTVYVDELQVWPGPKPRCFAEGSCHLTADTTDELHAFARRLGLRRSWFQPHRVADHYDLTAGRRLRAIALGAVQRSAREQARLRVERRYGKAAGS